MCVNVYFLFYLLFCCLLLYFSWLHKLSTDNSATKNSIRYMGIVIYLDNRYTYKPVHSSLQKINKKIQKRIK